MHICCVRSPNGKILAAYKEKWAVKEVYVRIEQKKLIQSNNKMEGMLNWTSTV